MQFKYLHLKKARKLHAKKFETPQIYPDRRKFVKAVGLGAIAWNPVFSSLKSLKSDSFQFISKKNTFKISNQNRIVWEISNKYFEKGYSIRFFENGNTVFLKAENLLIRGTNFSFSIKMELNKRTGDCQFEIPDFLMAWDGNFFEFLNYRQKIESLSQINSSIITIAQHENISASGQCTFTLNPDWKISLQAKNVISGKINNIGFSSNEIRIQPQAKQNSSIFKSALIPHTLIELPHFNDWNLFLNHINLNEGKLSTSKTKACTIQLAALYSKNNEKLIWIEKNNAAVFYQASKVLDS